MAMTHENEDSETERTVLCEKIISDIEAVLLKDNALESFEIIPITLQRNKSPVIHVAHNLGLESWCAQHVYEYVHNKLIVWKRKALPLRPSGQNYTPGAISRANEVATIQKYLNVALLINPDAQSFWHLRRYLYQRRRLLCLNDELRFTVLVLSKKSKSSEAFAYRRWLMTNAGGADTNRDLNSFRPVSILDWRTEIDICNRTSESSASNYHAWTHRQWVILNTTTELGRDLLLSSEFERIKCFMLKHITDYSCYHYRQWLISHAYRIRYFEEDLLNSEKEDPYSMQFLVDLRQLITYYLVADVKNLREILEIMLPDLDYSSVDNTELNSFLYCCNLSAHDVRLCEEQKNVYGEHESFDLHRRASLKFIIDQCVSWSKQKRKIPALDFREESSKSGEIDKKSEYETIDFLEAIKKSEGLLGARHRKWCSLFLGFSYTNDQKDGKTNDCSNHHK